MIYKINPDKKKEFEKWNFKQMLKQFLPIIVFGLLYMDFMMGFIFTKNDFLISLPVILSILIFSDLFLLIILLCSFLLSIKLFSSKLETWELTIEDNYARLKNSTAITTVNFTDLKKYKKDSNSIIFYLGGFRRFRINWNCFFESEKLKTELENIANKIGTYKKENVLYETQKTKVKFSSKYNLILYISIVIVVLVKILRKFF